MASKLSKYNNLTLRIITGLIGSAGIITAICLSPWTYYLIFFIICLFSLLEFYKLVGLDGIEPQRIFGTALGVAVYTLSFFVQKDGVSQQYYILIFPLVALISIASLYKRNKRKPFTNIAFTSFGLLYIAVPFPLLNIVAFENQVYHFEIILGCLLILWASDTGAYFAGTFLGKRKLFERISPKKSWEGFFGGAALALAFAYGLSTFFHGYTLIQWMVVGVIIVVGGTFGDLVESMLKRSIEIKDSGTSIPGHGGFLDRFDGLFISVPFIVAYLEVF